MRFAVRNPGISWLAIVVGWGVWAAATIGVLLCMELASSLLHGLRLFWIELSQRFYKGQGKPFTPLRLR